MIANVNEQLWIDFDLDTAVFLDTIAYWLKTNASNMQPRNFKDGRYWTYNTQTALQKLFPGWSRETIRRVIRNCVKNDLLLVNNFNVKNYDRTCWYSLPDKGLQYYPALSKIINFKPEIDGEALVDSNIALVDSNPAIPTLLPSSNINTNITTTEFNNSSLTTTKKKKGKDEELMELIDVYRDEFPNNPQPHNRVIATSLRKTLQTLVKRWPELDPNSRPISVNAFRRYLIALRESAPKFALGEYVTEDGNKRKNNLETFCRWNTVVKFLENQYS